MKSCLVLFSLALCGSLSATASGVAFDSKTFSAGNIGAAFPALQAGRTVTFMPMPAMAQTQYAAQSQAVYQGSAQKTFDAPNFDADAAMGVVGNILHEMKSYKHAGGHKKHWKHHMDGQFEAHHDQAYSGNDYQTFEKKDYVEVKAEPKVYYTSTSTQTDFAKTDSATPYTITYADDQKKDWSSTSGSASSGYQNNVNSKSNAEGGTATAKADGSKANADNTININLTGLLSGASSTPAVTTSSSDANTKPVTVNVYNADSATKSSYSDVQAQGQTQTAATTSNAQTSTTAQQTGYTQYTAAAKPYTYTATDSSSEYTSYTSAPTTAYKVEAPMVALTAGDIKPATVTAEDSAASSAKKQETATQTVFTTQDISAQAQPLTQPVQDASSKNYSLESEWKSMGDTAKKNDVILGSSLSR